MKIYFRIKNYKATICGVDEQASSDNVDFTVKTLPPWPKHRPEEVFNIEIKWKNVLKSCSHHYNVYCVYCLLQCVYYYASILFTFLNQGHSDLHVMFHNYMYLLWNHHCLWGTNVRGFTIILSHEFTSLRSYIQSFV